MTLVRTLIGLIAAFAIGAVSVHAIVGNTGASITLYQGFNEIVWTEPEADLAATLSPIILGQFADCWPRTSSWRG